MNTETSRKPVERPTPFMTIPGAAKVTGLSKYYLREGCKNGSVPHIMSGNTFYINVPALLDKLGIKDWF